jgi:rubrerythrin
MNYTQEVVIMNKNLIEAFISEGRARTPYTFHAKIAKKEGFQQIAWRGVYQIIKYEEH